MHREGSSQADRVVRGTAAGSLVLVVQGMVAEDNQERAVQGMAGLDMAAAGTRQAAADRAVLGRAAEEDIREHQRRGSQGQQLGNRERRRDILEEQPQQGSQGLERRPDSQEQAQGNPREQSALSH